MVRPPLDDARTLEFDWISSQADRARLCFAILDDECATILFTQVTVAVNVLFDFQFQCFRDGAPCPFSGWLVQRAHDLRDLSLDAIRGTFVHGVSFLRPRGRGCSVMMPIGYVLFLGCANPQRLIKPPDKT